MAAARVCHVGVGVVAMWVRLVSLCDGVVGTSCWVVRVGRPRHIGSVRWEREFQVPH